MTEHETALISLAMSGHVAVDIRPEMLSPNAAIIWDSILSLLADGIEPTPLTVVTRLERNGKLKAIGGRVAVFSIAEVQEPSATLGYHSKSVANAYVARKLANLWYESSKDKESLIEPLIASDRVIRETRSIVASVTRPRSFDTRETTSSAIDVLSKLYSGELIGTPTGFWYLDEITFGWLPSLTYCVTASQPGAGKSAFIQQTIREAAKHGHVLYVSGEMKQLMVWLRDIASRSGIGVHEIRSGRFNRDANRDAVKDAITAYQSENIHVMDQRGPTLDQISGELARIMDTYGHVSLVAVDMVQHIHAPGDTEWDRIDSAVAGMSEIAETYNVPVVYVSRANRREVRDGIPNLATPYGSSRVESDAICVFGLCRNEDYVRWKQASMAVKNENGKIIMPTQTQVWNRLGWQDPGEKAAVLMTLKNRVGPMLDMPMNFDGKTFTFSYVPKLCDVTR